MYENNIEESNKIEENNDIQVLESLPIVSEENQNIVENSEEIKENLPKNLEDEENESNKPEEKIETEDNKEIEKYLEEPFKDISKIKLESVLSDEIYVQMKRKFKKLLRSQINDSNDTKHEINENELFSLLRQYISGVTTAVIVQTLFHNFSLVLQGLLAGLSIGHCVFAFVFAEPNILIHGYQYIAIAVQATFYFCFAISTANAFDRFEGGDNIIDTFKKLLLLQKGGFNCIIWIIGLISSVLMAKYDEYLSKSDIEQFTNEQGYVLIIWRYLSLTRAICALIGWFFVALQPNTNYTRDRLFELVGVNDSQKVQKHLLNQQFESIFQQTNSNKIVN